MPDLDLDGIKARWPRRPIPPYWADSSDAQEADVWWLLDELERVRALPCPNHDCEERKAEIAEFRRIVDKSSVDAIGALAVFAVDRGWDYEAQSLEDFWSDALTSTGDERNALAARVAELEEENLRLAGLVIERDDWVRPAAHKLTRDALRDLLGSAIEVSPGWVAPHESDEVYRRLNAAIDAASAVLG